jgi:hypothetical protein
MILSWLRFGTQRFVKAGPRSVQVSLSITKKESAHVWIGAASQGEGLEKQSQLQCRKERSRLQEVVV